MGFNGFPDALWSAEPGTSSTASEGAYGAHGRHLIGIVRDILPGLKSGDCYGAQAAEAAKVASAGSCFTGPPALLTPP